MRSIYTGNQSYRAYFKAVKLRQPFIDAVRFCSLFIALFVSVHSSGADTDDLHSKIEGLKNKEKAELLIMRSNEIVASQPEKGLEFAIEAATLAQREKNRHLLSDAFKLQGDAYYYMDSLHASVQAYRYSAEVDKASQRPRPDSILRRLGDAGYVYYRLGWFDKAIEYHSRALNMSEQQKDTAEIATNLFNLGLSYKLTGRHDKAIEYFQRTLELDQLMGNEADMSSSYNSIGMVYLAWGKHEKALEFLEMAYELDLKNNEEAKMSIRLSNMSKIYMAMQNYDEATEALEQALEIDRRLNQSARIATRLHGLGIASKALLMYDKALEYYNEALVIFRSLNLEYKIATLLIHTGELYYIMEEHNKAERYFLEGHELARKNNLRSTEIEAARLLYRLYKERGMYNRALEYFENYKTLHDSVFSEESARLINEFEVKYETEKKDRENQLLLKENQIQKQNQQFSVVVIVILVLLSSSILWAFLLKRKSLLQSKALFARENELSRLKIESVESQNVHLREMLFAEEEIKKLQLRSLEQQKQELTTATMLIANKNEVFEKLKRLAEQIKTNGNNSGQDQAREIITEIDRQTDLGRQWEQFKVHFESIHRNFFDSLRKMNGCLTQNDLQLCAYIKLNLSTKEISRLMNITPESVNTHRYRLRKKLKLASGETLDDLVREL